MNGMQEFFQQIKREDNVTNLLEDVNNINYNHISLSKTERRFLYESDAARTKRLARNAERMRERRANETIEEYKKRLARNAENNRVKRLNENDIEKAMRHVRDAARQRLRRAMESPEQRAVRLAKLSDRMRIIRANESLDQRKERLEKSAARARDRLKKESDMEKQERRRKKAEYARKIRNVGTQVSPTILEADMKPAPVSLIKNEINRQIPITYQQQQIEAQNQQMLLNNQQHQQYPQFLNPPLQVPRDDPSLHNIDNQPLSMPARNYRFNFPLNIPNVGSSNNNTASLHAQHNPFYNIQWAPPYQIPSTSSQHILNTNPNPAQVAPKPEIPIQQTSTITPTSSSSCIQATAPPPQVCHSNRSSMDESSMGSDRSNISSSSLNSANLILNKRSIRPIDIPMLNGISPDIKQEFERQKKMNEFLEFQIGEILASPKKSRGRPSKGGESDDQRSERLRKMAELGRLRRANETLEQRQKRLKMLADRARQKREILKQTESEEERRQRLAKQAEYARLRRLKEQTLEGKHKIESRAKDLFVKLHQNTDAIIDNNEDRNRNSLLNKISTGIYNGESTEVIRILEPIIDMNTH